MDKWWNKFKTTAERLRHDKKILRVAASIVVISIMVFCVYQNGYSYSVSLNGKEIGIVQTKVIAEKALAEAEMKVSETYGESAKYDQELELNKVRVDKNDVMDQAQLSEAIYENLEIYKPAAVITVDGQEELILETEEQAESVLEYIKKPFLEELDEDENTEVIDVQFDQEVEIVTKEVPVDDIMSLSQARNLVTVEETQVKTYKVAAGDNAWNISRAHNISMDVLEEANPDKDIEDLMPGETINLGVENVEKPFIDVTVKINQTVEEEIDYDTQKEEDSSMYVGETKVKTEGKNGLKKIVKEVYYKNGVVEDEKILSEEVLEEPTDEIVLVGTKQRTVSRSYSNQPAPTYNGEIGSAIVATAKHYIGVPYVSGGSSPSGFDCSGFVQYVYKQYGISLPRTTGGQGSVGGYVSRSNLKPGDIVVFSGHTGIYVGNNSFIHSPSTGKTVQISSLSSSYWSARFKCGRRVY